MVPAVYRPRGGRPGRRTGDRAFRRSPKAAVAATLTRRREALYHPRHGEGPADIAGGRDVMAAVHADEIRAASARRRAHGRLAHLPRGRAVARRRHVVVVDGVPR